MNAKVQELFGKRFEAKSEAQTFTFSKKWMRPGAYILAPSMVIWNAVFFYFLWAVLEKSFTAMDTATLFGLLFVVVLVGIPFATYGILLTYYAYCMFFNKTILKVSHTGITMSNEPYRFNFLGYRSFTVPASQIDSVTVLANEEEEYGETTYQVMLNGKHEQQTRLYTFTEQAQADFLLENINKHLPQASTAQKEEEMMA